MISKFIKQDFIQFNRGKIEWKKAINIVAEPLLKNNIILPSYVDAMIETVISMGDYIVIVPKVAMPHARPEKGAIGVGISFLKSDEAIYFGDNADKEVFLVICLATNDNEKHLSLLQQISLLIDEEEKVNQLLATSNVEEFIQLANKLIEENKEEL